MERKIISLAKSTNVITLPSRWCEENSLGKGDSVSVSENGDSVVISPVAMEKTIVLDISGAEPMIRRILGAAYKSGYDLMEITYSSEHELETAEEVIEQEFVGFEIVSVNKEKTFLKAKSISEPSPEDFERMLRRMMRLISDMADDILKHLSEKEHLKKISEKDKEVNKIADYCRRIINRNSLLRLSERYVRNPPLYFIVEQLEKVSDGFRDLALCQDVIDEKMFSDVKDYFDDFYTLFYNFNFTALAGFGKRRYEMKEQFEKKRIDQYHYESISILRDILEKTFDMNGALIAINL
ncbi:MAG: AbrB/MazE/SpoVT family DNA-binding domain-containing protein [Candidatus Woesearchaeota archaeon]